MSERLEHSEDEIRQKERQTERTEQELADVGARIEKLESAIASLEREQNSQKVGDSGAVIAANLQRQMTELRQKQQELRQEAEGIARELQDRMSKIQESLATNEKNQQTVQMLAAEGFDVSEAQAKVQGEKQALEEQKSQCQQLIERLRRAGQRVGA